jgi:hypothetical protein
MLGDNTSFATANNVLPTLIFVLEPPIPFNWKTNYKLILLNLGSFFHKHRVLGCFSVIFLIYLG